MIAGMRSYLAAAGVDVEDALAGTRLVLSSEQSHLVDGHFDLTRLLDTLEDALTRALRDGYAGLFAIGDMTWEMGPHRDFSKLLEYEWRLEEFFRVHPEMDGVCQYHVDTLPPSAVRRGVLAHRAFFVNETLSLLNPQAVDRGAFTSDMADDARLDQVAADLCQAAGAAEPAEF